MKKIINIKTLSISAIIWGILFFIYNMFYHISAFDLLGSNYFFYSTEEKNNIELMISNISSILNTVFTIFLIAIIILLFIIYIKNTVKPVLSGIGLIILGLILLLLNISFVSWLSVTIGGIFLLIYKPNEE